MVFDLRAAMLKKEEIESARLADFAFRLRVRTMRLLAVELGVEEAALVRLITRADDQAIIADLSRAYLNAPAAYACCRAAARRALIAERGDPSPHRLA